MIRACGGPTKEVGEQLERGARPPSACRRARRPTGRRAASCAQQGADRPVGPETLVLEPAGQRRSVPGRGKHPRQLAEPVADEQLEPLTAERRGLLVERVDPDAERQRALELRAATEQHDVAASPGARGQLAQQARLAGAGLAADRHPASTGDAKLVERGDRGARVPRGVRRALTVDCRGRQPSVRPYRCGLPARTRSPHSDTGVRDARFTARMPRGRTHGLRRP